MRAHPHRLRNSMRRQPVMSPKNFFHRKRDDRLFWRHWALSAGASLRLNNQNISDSESQSAIFFFWRCSGNQPKRAMLAAYYSARSRALWTHWTGCTIWSTPQPSHYLLQISTISASMYIYRYTLSSFLPRSFTAWSLSGMLATFSLMNFWVTWVYPSYINSFVVASSQWGYLRRVCFTGCPQFLIGVRSGELWQLK